MKKTKSKYELYKPILVELITFVKRPGMYVGIEEMDLIIAFLAGVELSTKFSLRFKNDLIDYIFQKYPNNIELQELKSNLNYFTLKQQTEILSKAIGKKPVQTFKEEAIELLVYISDIELNGYFRQTLIAQLKDILEKNLDLSDEPFTNSFMSSAEDQIFRLFKDWTGKSLSNEQFQLLTSIHKVNFKRNMNWHNHKEGDIDDKSKLRNLSRMLLVELGRENMDLDEHSS